MRGLLRRLGKTVVDGLVWDLLKLILFNLLPFLPALAAFGALLGEDRLQPPAGEPVRLELPSPVTSVRAGPRTEPIRADAGEKVGELFLDQPCGGDGSGGRSHVVVLGEHYSWVYNEPDEIELATAPARLEEILASRAVRPHLEQADRLLVLGTASCEGYDSNPQEQRNLAALRAAHVAGRVTALVRQETWSREVQVEEVCLGVYRKQNCNRGLEPATKTWWQRRLVLVAFLDLPSGVDRRECMAEIFRRHDSLRHLADGYDPGLVEHAPGCLPLPLNVSSPAVSERM